CRGVPGVVDGHDTLRGPVASTPSVRQPLGEGTLSRKRRHIPSAACGLAGPSTGVDHCVRDFATKNPARTGAGIGLFAPLIDRQIARLSSRSSASSSCSNDIAADSFAPQASGLFTSFMSTAGLTCL